MNKATDCYRLANGVEIPCIGFGTWQTPDGDVAVASVKAALEAGYRHIDTAQVYGNEESVGQGIREGGVPRKDLFITTKVWNNCHTYDDTLRAFDESTKKLGIETVDLYLIHWPNPIQFRSCWEQANADTWRAMEKLYRDGRARAIGVSNFLPHHLDALAKTAEVAPMVNQIRLCPGETMDETVNYCRERGILLEAYSPLGTGKIFSLPEVQQMAEKYHRSVAQVCIRWSLQRGYLPLPKSVTPSRIKENLEVFDFELSPEDVQILAEIDACEGPGWDPDNINF